MIDDGFDHTYNQYEKLAAAYEQQRKEPLQSGFEDLPEPPKELRLCPSFEHKPPQYMSVPVGKRYRHVCPLCGTITYVNSNVMLC